MNIVEENLKYEKTLIAFCLKDIEYYYKCITEGIRSDFFRYAPTRKIWDYIEKVAVSEGISPLIIADQYKDKNANEKEQIIAQLENLKNKANDPSDFFYAVRKVKETHYLLALKQISNQIDQMVDEGNTTDQIISEIMSKVFSIGSTNDNIRELNTIAALEETGKEIAKRLNGEITDGVPSGIKTLDKEIKCFYYGLYSLIIARPGHCKTTLMINAFVNNIKQGYKPVFISLEMPAIHLMIKILAIWTKIEVSKIMNPKTLSRSELQMLRDALTEMSKYDFYIVDAVSMTVTECAIILYKYAKFGCHIAYLDYFQLLKLPNGNICSDAADFMKVSKYMREYIKNVNRVGNMALVMGAQAGRDVEKRPIEDRIPQMSDLQWSSSLEQDAGVVIGLMNREKYEGDKCEYPNQLFVGFPKHRFENAVRVNLAFIGSIQFITDLAQPERIEKIPANV